jgi:hypothetical protein
MSTAPDAKRTRIKNLEFLLGHDRLWFVIGSWIDEMFKQLKEYNGKKSTTYRKDDIPDCLSFIIEHLPPSALVHNPDPKQIEAEQEKRLAEERRKAQYKAMFGGQMPPAVLASEIQRRLNGQPQAPPPITEEPTVDPRRALLAKILPGGMRI